MTAAAPTTRRQGLRIAFTLSLLTNLALVAAIVRHAGSEPSSSAAPAPAPALPPALTETTSPAPADADTDALPDDPFIADSNLWARIETADPAELVARLRAAGLNEELIRAIIWDRIYVTAETSIEVQNAPYWLRGARASEAMASVRTQRDPQTGMRPDQAQFRALFGTAPGMGFVPGRMDVHLAPSGLSREGTQVLTDINNARSAAQRELMETLRAVRDPAEREAQLAPLRAQYDDQIRASLSPADYQAYLRDGSNAAQLIKNRASGLALSQAEFDATLRILQDIPENRGDLTPYRDDLIAALGEARFQELQQASNGDARTNQLVERLGLSYSTATALDNLRADTTARSRAIQRDRNADPAARQQQLAELVAEAQNRLGTLLPPEGVDAYRASAGTWIDQLDRTSGPGG